MGKVKGRQGERQEGFNPSTASSSWAHPLSNAPLFVAVFPFSPHLPPTFLTDPQNTRGKQVKSSLPRTLSITHSFSVLSLFSLLSPLSFLSSLSLSPLSLSLSSSRPFFSSSKEVAWHPGSDLWERRKESERETRRKARRFQSKHGF
jgi:hypothetical protein